MAAQAYTPEVDSEDPPKSRQRLLKAVTATGREGASWEALYWALCLAQGSPNGPDLPEQAKAPIRQAKAMRNLPLHHPFDDSPAAIPWHTDPPKTVWKLAGLTRNRVKARMQTLAEIAATGPQPAGHTTFLQSPRPSGPTTSSPPGASTEKKGRTRPWPPASQSRRQGDNLPPLRTHPSLTIRPTRPPTPTQTRHPSHPPFCHKHRRSPKHTQSSRRAPQFNNLSATNARATGSGATAQSSTAPKAKAETVGCKCR